MKRRRRCQVCKELFSADPRVGDRQKSCRRPQCQRERHRRSCAEWRQREHAAVEEDRLRRKLGAPQGELRLGVVRDECGPKIKVVLEESLRLISTAARDEFQTKTLEQRQESLRLVEKPPRDETDARRRDP